MTLKQTLKLIFGGIFAFILTLLGIQRKTIVKQKEEIKAKKAEIKVKEAQAEASQEILEASEKISVEEEKKKEIIQEAKNEEETIVAINDIIRSFNDKL